jgi:hypothetical protein
VQGRLREELLSVVIETECKHCHRPMRIEMDNNFNYRMGDENAAPLVFTPDINWEAFGEPNIIHAY